MGNLSSLSGKRIIVTRARAQAAALADKLAAAGATPILFPTIEIAPLADYTALDEAIRSLAQYQWVIFTSVNGVAAFWDRLDLLESVLKRSPTASLSEAPFRARLGTPCEFILSEAEGRALSEFGDTFLGLKDLTGLNVAAIGPATAQALTKRGVNATFIPEEYVAEAIVAGIGEVRGQKILLPRAEIAREALAVELTQRGAGVDEIAAYRTLPAAPDPNGLAELERGVDAVTFTSSSTVRNFVALTKHSVLCTQHSVLACIGPITAQTARELGLAVDVVAAEYTMDGLVVALMNYYQELRGT